LEKNFGKLVESRVEVVFLGVEAVRRGFERRREKSWN
jgi:hypothetical protein